MRPELLTGEDEARLEFLGATAGLTEPGPYLVVDVGGGSTEFIVGTDEPEGADARSTSAACGSPSSSCTPIRRRPRS